MVVSIGKIGVAHADYYTGRASGSEGYYTDSGERPGRWIAAGAMSVTAGSEVTRDDLRAVLSCVDPATGEQLGRKYETNGRYSDALGVRRRRKAMSAYDLTYSVPKSVSVAWALAGDETRAEIEAAFDASVAAVVGYLQERAVASRAAAGGTERVEVPDGATVARFDHRSSRSGDPQLHAHLLFSNRVLCADAKWRTLDGRLLYAHAMPASLYGAAVLRTEISQRLGWHWDRVGQNLHAEIAGTDNRLSVMWSQRSREVAREAQRRIRDFETTRKREPTTTERLTIWDQATVASRATKDLEALTDPFQRWHHEADDAGIDADELLGSYPTAQRVAPDTYDRPEVVIAGQRVLVADDAVGHLAATVEDMASSLSDADIDKAVYATVTAGGALAGAGEGLDATAIVDQLAAALRTRIEDRLVTHAGRWYSPGLLAAETATAAWLASPAADPEASLARLGRLNTEGLGDDQAQAARDILAAASTATAVIGPAGAGKTTMLERVAAATGAHNVIAAAPTAVAAGTLGAALGVRSDTVARLLVAEQNPVPTGGIVIIDEATQLGTRDLAAVCGLAAQAEARVVLVGDPAQQGSIAAGGMFAALAEAGTVTTVALAELWRFEDPAEAAATVRLRAGDRNSLDYHTQRGRVSEAAHSEVAETAADWWQARPEATRALSAPTRDLVAEINAEIAARRHAAGETGEGVLGEGPATIRVGDVATTRRNNRRLVASDGQWVSNGDRWTIEAHTAGGRVTLRRLDSDAIVALPSWYAQDHLELGYAVTQTRAQSVTVEEALTVVTASSRLSEMYVGLTRGTNSNELLIVTDQRATDEDTPPEQVPAKTVLDAVFSRSGHQAVATDPAAGPSSRTAAGLHLRAVAGAVHTQPLPVPDGFDALAVLQHANQAELRRRADHFEHSIEEAIEVWAQQFELKEAQENRSESEVLADLDELRSLGEHATTDTPAHDPDGFDPDSYTDYDDPDSFDADSYTDLDVPAAVIPPAEAGPVTLHNELVGHYGATPLAFDTLGLGPAIGDLRRLVAQHPHAQQPRLATDNNPALVELVASYQRSEHTNSVGASSRLAALAAAVADPPLRRELQADPDIAVSDTALSAEDRAWARGVRLDLLHRRAALWAPLLDELEARREVLRRTAAQALAGTDLPWAVDGDTLEAHDRSLWQARCLLWLDADATARGLADIWSQTNSSLADVAAGAAQPCRDTHTATEPPWRTLAEASPPAPQPAPGLPDPGETLTHPAPAAPRGDDPAQAPRAAAAAAADWYHHQLLHSSDPDAAEARHYLTSRGTGVDDWKHWNLGWAPDRWRNVTNHLKDDQAAVDAGIANRNKNGRVYDVMRGRVVIPIADPDGTVVAFAGRTLHHSNDTPKYLNTRTTALFSKSSTLYGLDKAAPHIAASGAASLVEGYLDVIAAHKAGIHNTVAACGTAVTAAHIDAIDAAGAHQLHIALDGDDAGRAAARAAMRLARDSGLPTRTVQLPQGEDPASINPDELQRLWHSAQPQPWATITAQLNASAPATSPEAAARTARAIADETAATGRLTRLVATHQTATTCAVPFHLLLADTRHQRPNTTRPADSPADSPADTAAAARTYGLPHNLPHNEAAHQIDDIATAIEALNAEPPKPARDREPARSL